MSEQVKIRIKATVTDLVLAEKYRSSCINGFFTADDGKIYPAEKLGEACDEVMEYTVFGEYAEENGKCTIRYTETADIGYANCVTALIFDPCDRRAVTMVRNGDVSTACRFDMKERRQICSYETPIMPVEFMISTRSVHNTVDRDGGAILLDYFIEIRGVNAERNRMFIEVQPV